MHYPQLRGTLAAVLAVMTLLVTACDSIGQSSNQTTGAGGGCSAFEGEKISLVVPFTPGGGYDSYARMIAPYLGEELGADVVVENRDGAGGLLAINQLVASEPDGTSLAIMNGVGIAAGALVSSQGVQFKLEDLSNIGRVAASSHIFSTGADSRYQNFDDVLNASGFSFGTTGPGAADYVNANVLIEIFGLDARVISGFEGSEENELALTKGEIDGMTGDFDSRLPAIENGDHRALLILGQQPDDALPDTPAMGELDLDEQQQELATSLYDLLELGRPIVGPPNMPQDRLSCLRDALQATVDNPDLIAESKKTERPINWMTGEDVDDLVQTLENSPPRFIDVLEKAYAGT